jgi:anti-anti-sigma regulatory factor
MASGGKLRLVGVSRHVLELLTYAGFDQIFEIEAGK